MQERTINLNEADREELEQIEGIDGERSSALVRKREQLGGFKDWSDVDQTPGFDGVMMAKLRAEAVLGREDTERQAERSGARDLNRASEEDLMEIQQIDGIRARMIVEHRPFSSWQDVENIEGIGETLAAKLRERFELAEGR